MLSRSTHPSRQQQQQFTTTTSYQSKLPHGGGRSYESENRSMSHQQQAMTLQQQQEQQQRLYYHDNYDGNVRVHNTSTQVDRMKNQQSLQQPLNYHNYYDSQRMLHQQQSIMEYVPSYSHQYHQQSSNTTVLIQQPSPQQRVPADPPLIVRGKEQQQRAVGNIHESIGSTYRYPTIGNMNQIIFSNNADADLPKIELSDRQRELLYQRQQHQESLQRRLSQSVSHQFQQSDSSPTPFQTRSNVVPVPFPSPPPPEQMFHEPWDKPFVVHRNTPQKNIQPTRSKTLVQSMMDHPLRRHHQSPTASKLVSPAKQSQNSRPVVTRTVDPPAAKDETSSVHTAASSQEQQPMETQRLFLRNLLMKKHSKNVLPTVTATASNASSQRSASSRHHPIDGTSPKALLHRVLQKASAMSPKDRNKQHQPIQVSNKSSRNMNHQKSKDDSLLVLKPSHSNPSSSSNFLKDQMRQRFQQKNQNRQGLNGNANDSNNHKNILSSSTDMEVDALQKDVPRKVIMKHQIDGSGTNDDASIDTNTQTPGYDKFVESLMKEVSSHHSQLYASFVVTLDPIKCDREEILQQCILSPKNGDKVDKQMVQKLHLHLQKQFRMSNDMCRSVSQLINDKQYKKQQKSGVDNRKLTSQQHSVEIQSLSLASKAKTMPLPENIIPSNEDHHLPVQQNRAIEKPRRQSEPVNQRNQTNINDYDEVIQSRSSDSTSNSETLKTSTGKSRLSVEIPVSHSSDSTNDTSPTTSSTAMTETNSIGSIQTSSESNSVKPTHSEAVEEPPWNRIQLRAVSSQDSNDDPNRIKAKTTSSNNNHPEWANITLRPVSCRSDHVQNDTAPTPIHVLHKPVEIIEHMSMDEIMENENVTMIRIKEDIIVCCDDNSNCRTMESRVVIAQSVIRHIRYDPVDMTVPVTVLWTLPRNEMEPDGMTLNMTTLKVTLLMRNNRMARKVLTFESSEDCLRFATAFYNMPLQTSGIHEQTQGENEFIAVPQTIIDVTKESTDHVPISTQNNSSVQTLAEPLNDEEQVVLEKYRELRQIKQASDALLETIALQNALTCTTGKQAQVKAISSASMPSNVDADVGDLPTSPISTFTATTVGENQQFSEDEKKIIEKYKIMLQRGVPPDAVRHKMTLDQVAVKIASHVFANDDTSVESLAVSKNEKETNTTESKKNDSNLSADENDTAEKYRKMLKLRIPTDAVRHKMIQDQISNKIVAAVLGEEYEPAVEKVNIPDTSAESISTAKTNLSEEEESVAAQYRKLLKINVSRDALLTRMQREGVSSNVIIAILGQSALLSASDEGNKVSSSSSTGSKMISINWDHTTDPIAGSVWEVWQHAEPEPMDFTQLKQMFQRKDMLQKDKKKNDETAATGKAKLLDITRSNNIAISLKAFKEFSHSELAETIRCLDPTRKIRGERTSFIRDLLPTLTEVKLIDDYIGSDDRLVPAELWFRHLRGIKRIDRKAQVIRTMEMYTSDSVEVRDNFRLLARVCREVMTSTKLQDVLGMVLRIGNVMNEGTRNGRAAGFKFNSLLRLTQTKTADGKITVLDYLVSVFIEKGETDTLDLISDFPDCHKVSRFLISDMTNEVKSLKASLQVCRQELADMEREQNPQEQKGSSTTAMTVSDPRSQLFASILSRNTGSSTNNDSLPTLRKSAEPFSKRNEFLAAIQGTKTESQDKEPRNNANESRGESSDQEMSNKVYENTLSGGISRLKKFLELVDDSFARLEKTRDDALLACKDLSRYCGETSGAGVTISLLDVLSQFIKNLEDAVKKHIEQQTNDARKLKKQEKELQSTKAAENVQSATVKEGKSIVLVVNNILKNANPRFKEDFKKGRDVPNPSNELKMVYEHERKNTTIGNLRLDIVSAIQQRAENVNDEEIEKARTTFAGVQALPDDTSPRELNIDPNASFPSPNSQSGESSATSELKLSVKQRATMLDPSSRKKSCDGDSDKKLKITAAVATSEDTLQNTTPKESDSSSIKTSDFGFDIRSSQDRLRTRQSLPHSSINERGSLEDVMKSLDEIKKHATSESISATYSSPEKKVHPQRMNSETPPVHTRSVERKSISERARDKRAEKRPSSSHQVLTSTAASNIESTQSTQLRDATGDTSVNASDTGLTTITSSLSLEETPNLVKDTAFARLARQKRLQKRISK